MAAEVADALPSFGRSFSVKSADLAAAAGNFLWLASYEFSRAGVVVPMRWNAGGVGRV